MTEPSIAEAPTTSRDGRVRWYDLIIAFVGGNIVGVIGLVLAGVAALLIARNYGVKVGSQQDLAALANSLQTNFWAIHVSVVVSDLCVLAAVWFVAWRRFAHPFGVFFPPVGLGTILLAAASGAGLSILLNGSNELLAHSGWVHITDLPSELALVPHGAAQIAGTIAVVALFAPFVEEYFFRGLFFAWAKRWGTAFAVTITALVFALVHGHLFIHPGVQGWLYSFELFLAGVVLALWVVRTGSLRTSFATHAAYNATAILFTVLVP